MEVSSGGSSNDVDLCFMKTDKKNKRLNLSFKRNTAHSGDKADVNTLDSLNDDLKLL